MDAAELLAGLDKVRFFEGYTAEAERRARGMIARRYEKGLSGESRMYFERFPGFALTFFTVGLELDGAEDLKLVLKEYAKGSLGMFKPTGVSAVCDPDEDVTRLGFSVGGVRYEAEAGYSTWVPEEVMGVIEKAFKEHRNKLCFHVIHFPEFSQDAQMTICTARAMKAVVKAGLLPKDYRQANDSSEYDPAE